MEQSIQRLEKLFHVQEYYGKRNVSTITGKVAVNFPIARAIKRREEISNKYAKGTYFKIKKA